MVHIDPREIRPSIIRLKRARGQLDAVIRMLEDGDACEDAIIQLSAAAKAIDRAGYSIIATGLKQCYREDGDGCVDAQTMEKLFLSLA